MKLAGVLAVAGLGVIGLVLLLSLKSDHSPPSVSLVLLGYTNRTGPYALLGITNRSASAITLDSQCLVKYANPSSGGGAPRVTSIEPNLLRLTRLDPQAGFVQEVFVFPGTPCQWRVDYSASYRGTFVTFFRSWEQW